MSDRLEFSCGDLIRHVASKGLYVYIGRGHDWDTQEELCVYESVATHQLWLRDPTLMFDGRFALVETMQLVRHWPERGQVRVIGNGLHEATKEPLLAIQEPVTGAYFFCDPAIDVGTIQFVTMGTTHASG